MAHRPSPKRGKAWQHLTFEERFTASFRISEETGCWEWLKPSSSGYGAIDFQGKTIPAHRASWLHHAGEIKDGLCVLHKCDNRKCVNPNHLYLGDKKQNRKDFMERHPRSADIVRIGIEAGAKGVKRFWDSMNAEQRKEFCAKRAQIKKEKQK